jgi:hypothetical protein
MLPRKAPANPKKQHHQKMKLQFSLTTLIITCLKARTKSPSKQPKQQMKALETRLFLWSQVRFFFEASPAKKKLGQKKSGFIGSFLK